MTDGGLKSVTRWEVVLQIRRDSGNGILRMQAGELQVHPITTPSA